VPPARSSPSAPHRSVVASASSFSAPLSSKRAADYPTKLLVPKNGAHFTTLLPSIIEAFDYDGTVSNRRLVTTSGGIPDGSCLDLEGYLWNAVWDSYRVERYSPKGQLDGVIDVPVRKPTCVAFGGRDLSTLFITSSRAGEDEEQLLKEPEAGGLYAIDVGVRGSC
jgi:L-arabinonolactonase